MLSILAMDILHRLITQACTDSLLRPMEPHGVSFRCSLYADDVILFIRPTSQEAVAIKELFTIFEEATGLRTNLAKCSITPIYGGKDTLDEIVQILGCEVKQFPVCYLGLPLSTKITKVEVHTLSQGRCQLATVRSWRGADAWSGPSPCSR
jgi:hypothetical protein